MIPEQWRYGEIAVIGLGRSGKAACRWLVRHGLHVYASDASPRPQDDAADLGDGVAVEWGGHDVERVRRSRLVVVSPGVPPTIPALEQARAAGVEIVGELELAVRAMGNDRLIVVTGTNGKTTTTTLVTHLLASAGRRARSAGNIGDPLIELVDLPDPPDWLVVEASSFQLHDAPTLAPAMGVVTNLAPDHLDRYPSLADYYADKARLFRNASPKSHWFLNGDDAAVESLADGALGQIERWSLAHTADAWYEASSGALRFADGAIVPRDRIPLLGDHNVGNALAAALVARAAGLRDCEIGHGLETAPAVPHRLEVIETAGPVRWVNDSKATNVMAVRAALRAMDRPFVLILGGRNKGERLEVLRDDIDTRCRGVVAYGEARDEIAGALADHVAVTTVERFDRAVEEAAQIATAGDSILLAPACASFDQFPSYEARGEAFRAIALSL